MWELKFCLCWKWDFIFFSVAFAVDPLYHQTSAQFDEGGAKGLLLNNLGVYGGCRVLFDSQEVPGKCTSCENQREGLDMVELSFARGVVFAFSCCFLFLHSTFKNLFESVSASFSFTFQITLNKWY